MLTDLFALIDSGAADTWIVAVILVIWTLTCVWRGK